MSKLKLRFMIVALKLLNRIRKSVDIYWTKEDPIEMEVKILLSDLTIKLEE